MHINVLIFASLNCLQKK